MKVPVPQPVLTLIKAKAELLEEDEVTFLCEVHGGSPRIQYQLFYEGTLLQKTESRGERVKSATFILNVQQSGNYYCTAENGAGLQRSAPVSLSVIVPVSRPILNLMVPGTRAMVGDTVEFHCEALRGSFPILYQFYHEDDLLESSPDPYGGGASFKLLLTEEHSGNYLCEASNGRKAQPSEVVTLNVLIPVSHPVLTLKASRAQAVVGDMMELHCEAQRGSPPILYRFHHGDTSLGNSSALSGEGASFKLSLTSEHSGNYSCDADNGFGVQHSEVVTLFITVPVSRPVLTLKSPRAQTVVGDVLELHCEAQRGSLPILYQFYRENVTLGNSSAVYGGGMSSHLFLTAEHSGNYSCGADNGFGVQRSEVVTLFITGMTENGSGAVATGVAGGLLSIGGLAAGALAFYCWLTRKGGRRSASDPSRSPSDSSSQEPTYHNVPAWIELQPVYINGRNQAEEQSTQDYCLFGALRRQKEEPTGSQQLWQKGPEFCITSGVGCLRLDGGDMSQRLKALTDQGDTHGHSGQAHEEHWL
ncbi:Fc receptor-like protein 5 [Ctenodactylus gundi]